MAAWRSRVSTCPATKLRVFQDADQVVETVYRATRLLPADERFGLQAQIRRAAVSVTTDLVEGASRRTTSQFVQFVEAAIGSASEVKYLLTLSARLGVWEAAAVEQLNTRYTHVVRSLQKLIDSLDPQDRRP